ncbi:MAG: hypothetical protein DRM99_02455 [Thermoplasmata archaeon]|nr:MAG: hypothetical protein DRM99_02455 [Thermoplasmata archaeon]
MHNYSIKTYRINFSLIFFHGGYRGRGEGWEDDGWDKKAKEKWNIRRKMERCFQKRFLPHLFVLPAIFKGLFFCSSPPYYVMFYIVYNFFGLN